MIRSFNTKKLTLFLSSNVGRLTIIILLIILAYLNIFPNSFQGDDYPLILNWDFVKNFEIGPRVFTENLLPESHFGYRPIRTIITGLAYQLFGSNPLGYHFYSLFIHFVQIILIFLIAKQITKNKLVTFVSALIFALHPVQVESVTHIIVALDGMGYIFFLSSFFVYLKSTEKVKINKTLYGISFVLALSAFFSYELSITLSLVLVLNDFCFRRELFKPKNIRQLVIRYLPFFLGAIGYLIIRFSIIQGLSNSHYLADSFYLTMLTMTRAFMLYLGLLIAPINLSINHSVLPGVMSWVDAFTNMESITSQSIFQLDILLNWNLSG